MTKRPVRLSPRAERWLLTYIATLAEQNPGAARDLLLRLDKLKERLEDFPNMSEQGPLPGTRRMVMRPLILTTRLRDNVLEIAAIRHERQEAPVRGAPDKDE